MHLQSSSYTRQSGFTLVEVLVALFIFVFGILGVFAMQIHAIHGNSSAQRLTEASGQAQDVLEDIVERPYADFLVNPLPSTSTSTLGLFKVTQSIKVLPLSLFTSADAIWVTATVAWQDMGGPARNMSVSFIKSKNVETSYAKN